MTNTNEAQKDPFWLTYYKLPLIITSIVVAIDQYTKYLTTQKLVQDSMVEGIGRYTVIKNWLTMVHVRNPGAAWGILEGRTYLLSGISLCAALFLIFNFKKCVEGLRIERAIALAVMIGGIIGNFIDRAFVHEVVDFVWFHHNTFSYPAFNVADIAITCGVAVYMTSAFLFPNKDDKETEEKDSKDKKISKKSKPTTNEQKA